MTIGDLAVSDGSTVECLVTTCTLATTKRIADGEGRYEPHDKDLDATRTKSCTLQLQSEIARKVDARR